MTNASKENAALKSDHEELLRQIEIRDIALNSTKILIRIVDLQGKVQFINPTHKILLGYSEKDRIGKSTFDVVHPDDKERVVNFFFRHVEHPELGESPPIEYRMRHKQGHYLWARATGRLVKIKGRPSLIVITVWDITESKMMEDQLHALAERLQTIREEERTLISREIHDEFGQAMTSLKFDLALLVKNIPKDNQPALDKAKSMMKYIDQTIQLIRRISTELRPPILDDFGLKAAIEWQAEDFQNKTGIKCVFKSNLKEEIPIGKEKTISVFRIFQEALTNVARHAKATKVDIEFNCKKNLLTMLIKDNGRGIAKGEILDKKSLGIIGMKERAFSLNGDFRIQAGRGKGTSIQFSMPL
jgi:PAS domain S-box-containing protein